MQTIRNTWLKKCFDWVMADKPRRQRKGVIQVLTSITSFFFRYNEKGMGEVYA